MRYMLPFWYVQLTLFNCCSISLFWLHHICQYSQRRQWQHISHCNRGIPMWKEGVFLLRLYVFVHCSTEESWIEKRGHGAIVMRSKTRSLPCSKCGGTSSLWRELGCFSLKTHVAEASRTETQQTHAGRWHFWACVCALVYHRCACMRAKKGYYYDAKDFIETIRICFYLVYFSSINSHYWVWTGLSGSIS